MRAGVGVVFRWAEGDLRLVGHGCGRRESSSMG
ncbi:hypothetical protein SFR_2448 [Streptomyces sp. FR-008]|nr:hypothetical protein SFR_2448 [Streptomyces sp. FR-008]